MATPKIKPVKAIKLWSNPDWRNADDTLLATKRMRGPHTNLILVFNGLDRNRLIEQVAHAIDPSAFRRYKQGECFSVERINDIQFLRERTAVCRAKAVLHSIGLSDL
jgi:hypothetical protein